MKKKRIAALLLTAFLIVNEAVYPVDQYVTYAQSEPEEELNLEEGETEETVFSDQENNEENSQEIGIEPEREEQDEKPGEELLFSDGENTEETQETGEGLSAEDGTILPENTDFVFDDKGVLTEYKGTGGTVVIPPDVTEIGDDVFKNNQTITAVEFPEGLKKIGSNAFSGCSGLEGELQLPDSLETIGINAFYNCNNITGKLIIPDKISQIPYGAFSGMQKVTSVVLGEKVEIIWTSYNSGHAFYQWNNVETVRFQSTVPPTVKSNYSTYSVFEFMPNLKTVYIPQGTYQVYNSQYGDGIKAGAILKEEGSGDFVITDGELISYSGTDTEVTVPDQVTRIGAGAFRNNTTIQKVTLPAGVTAIGTNAFNNCTALTEVDYTDSSSLTEIGENAFSGCTSLEQTVLGENVTKLGTKAFYNCKKLNLSMTLPKKLTVIEPSVFQGCMGLSGNLAIPEGVTTIGENAFYGCSGLTGDLDIPEKVTIIGEYAFNGCSGFGGTLTLPDSLKSIGRYAFCGCSEITGELVIPGKITEIPYGTFSGMQKVTSVVLGEKVETIWTSYNSGHAFYQWNNVETVRFLSTVPPTVNSRYSRKYSVFYSMPNLKKIYVLPDSLERYKETYGSGVKDSVEWSTDTSELPPSGLLAECIYSHSVYLTWKPADSDIVEGYQVYRDGTEKENLLTETPVKDTFYRDEGLKTEETHIYYVCTSLTNGKRSSFAQVTATTKAPSVRKIYTDSSRNRVGIGKNKLYAEVADSTNLKISGIKETRGEFYYLNQNGRKVYIGEGKLTAGKAKGTAIYETSWNFDDLESGSYEVVFVLTDGDGESAEQKAEVQIDKSRPEQIQKVTATGDVDQVIISWRIAAELSTTGYRIYRKAETDEDYRVIGYINERNTVAYTDKSVKQDRTYQYYVTGVNEFKVESLPSEIVSASPSADTEKPQIIKMYPSANSRINGSVSLGARAVDNIGIREIKLWVSTDQTNWSEAGIGDSDFVSVSYNTEKIIFGKLWLRGIAVDTAGNESEPVICEYLVDNEGPSAVKILEEKCTVSSVTATLVWENVSEEDVGYFRVEQLTDGKWTTVGDVRTTLGINLYGLLPETEYTYRVIAYDQLGNRGAEPEKPFMFFTKADDTPPVITALSPESASFSSEIFVSAEAEDNCGIRKIILQVSENNQDWNNIAEKEFADGNKKERAEAVLSVKEFEEGIIYFRAVAEDINGHVSETGSKAPFVQYYVDHTPPEVPVLVSTESENGYIELLWKQGTETDLAGYSVFRQENDGEYKKIAENLYQVNYIDRDVQEGVSYRYRLQVKDEAGNISEFSGEMIESVKIPEDTDKPEILSVYPSNGSAISDQSRQLRVAVQDNRNLDSLTILWKKETEEEYQILLERKDIQNWSYTADVELPTKKLQDEEQIDLEIQASDTSGNVSDIREVHYKMDLTAPALNGVNAVYSSGRVLISWNSELPEDLAGFRIYRKSSSENTWKLIGQQEVTAGKKDYTFTDENLPLGYAVLEYKVEAVDNVQNISYRLAENPVVLSDRMKPEAVLECETELEVGVEYLFDGSGSAGSCPIISYEIDFGDGSVSEFPESIHKYEKTGKYTVKLSVTDENGKTAAVKKEIKVCEENQLGRLEVLVKDPEGQAMKDADVYFNLGSDAQVIRHTDGNGKVTFTAKAGTYPVGCIAGNNQYQPVKKEMVITKGKTTRVGFSLVEQPLVEGYFQVERMTFDEIKAAGIDLTSADSSYWVNVKIKVKYGREPVAVNVRYNVASGRSNVETMTVKAAGENRELSFRVISGGDTQKDTGITEVSVVMFDIPTGVSALKEFFDVRLHIINNMSEEYSLLNNEIRLNIPEGLEIVASQNNTELSSHVSVPEIKGQETKTLEWILRGDEIGEYTLEATYSGILSEFNRPVKALFQNYTPIQVYGLTGMVLTVYVGNRLKDGYAYYALELANASNKDCYCPRIDDMEVPGELHSEKYFPSGSDTGLAIPESQLIIMKPGDMYRKYFQYAVSSQLSENEVLADLNAELDRLTSEMQNSYGLQVELVKRDLDSGFFPLIGAGIIYQFDSQGGTPVNSITEIPKGATIQVPESPKKEGKFFAGWFENPDGTGNQLTHKTKAQTDTLWYAAWSDDPSSVANLLTKLSSDQYGFHVTDNEGNPIEGALIKRTDERGMATARTDQDGDAAFPSFTVGIIRIDIEKDGYLNYKNNDYEISTAGYDVIPLYRTMQENYLLEKAVYSLSGDGTSVSNCDLLKKAKRISADMSLYFEIACKAAGNNTTRGRFELWQGEKRLATADTDGVFRNLEASMFGTGKGIYVRNYYDEQKYVRTLLNLEITETPKVKGSLYLGKECSFAVDDNVPFLGGYKLNTGLPSYPLTVHAETDGSIIVGLNLKKGILDKKERRKEMQKWVSSMRQGKECGAMNTEDINKRFSEYCQKAGTVSLSGWNIKPPEMKAFGYFEGKLSSGNISKLEGYVCFSIKQSAKYGWTIPTAIAVPVVVEVGATGEGNFFGTVTYDLETNNLSGTIGLDLSVSLDVLGGIGVSQVTAAGVTGKGTLDFEIYFASTNGGAGLNSVELTAEMGVKAYMGRAEISKNYLKKKYYLYTRNNQREDRRRIAALAEVLYDEDSYTTVDRSYLENQSDWMGSEENTGAVTPLLTNTYGGSDPQIVSANGASVMVFRYDGGDRDVWNMGQLMYSVYKDGKWQEPASVDDNDLADISFQLYSDGQEIYLSYQEAKEKLTEETSSLKELTKHTSLKSVKFDTSEMKFTEGEKVSEETEVYSFRPQTAVVNGEEIMTWIGNTNSDIFTLNSSNQLLCRIKKDGQWGETRILTKDSNYISSFCTGELNGKTMVLYCVDGDNDPGTTVDGRIYGTDLEGNILFQEEGGCTNIIYVNDQNSGLQGFVWEREGKLWYRDSLTEDSRSLMEEGVGTNSTFKICGDTIYYVDSDSSGNQNIFAVRKKNGVWAAPVQITSQKDIILSFSVCRRKDGDYLALMQCNKEDKNTISWMKVGEVHDIVLAGTSFEMEKAIPGKKLQVKLQIQNAGSKDITEIGYRVLEKSAEENGENKVLLEKTKELWIPSGQTVDTEISIPIPEDLISGKLSIQVWEVNEGEKVTELSEENNSAEITAGLTDLGVSMILYTAAGKNTAVVTVKNNSNVTSGGSLKIYDTGRSDGVLVQDRKIRNLKAGEEQAFRLEITEDAFAGDVAELELAAEIQPDVADYAEENNRDTVIVEKMARVKFYSEGTLIASDLYHVGETLIWQDSPEGDGEFEGWYIDGIPAEKEITVNSNMEFYAVFRKEEQHVHSWEKDWKTVQEATVLKEGIQQRFCTECGEKQTRSVKKLKATISVTATSIVLKVKQSTTKIKINGLARGDKVSSWKSSNKKIVTVSSSGKITAGKTTGKAKITVTLRSGLKKVISVKVQKTAVVTAKINGVPKNLVLKKGRSQVLKPGILPVTSLQKVTFASSNKKIATVSSSGKIIARKKGKAIITVKSGRRTVKCRITVK